MTIRKRWALMAPALIAATGIARAQTSAPKEEQISLGLKTLPRSQVEAAYKRIWSHYAYVAADDDLRRAGSVRAIRIEGAIVGVAGGRRVIVESGERRYAVILRSAAPPVRGASVRLMALPCKTPTFSWESGADTRESLPQYEDCTLTFEEFVAQLRRGAHFPEAPELGTKPNRIGLFQTGNGDRNKVIGLVAERERQSAETATGGGGK